MKIREIIQGYTAVTALQARKLPVKVSYAIARNSKRLLDEVTQYETARLKVCEDAAEKDEDGNPVIDKIAAGGAVSEQYRIPAEAREKVDEDIRQLLDTDVDIDLMMVPADELERIDTDKRFEALTPQELMAIDFMIS